jgi:hypothetical protein
MSFKELTAVIEIAGAAAITAWLLYEATNNPLPAGDLTALAMRLVIAIGLVIVFNIIVTIVMTIVVSIIQRAELKDEKDDERDRSVATRGGRNGYVVTSILAVGALLWLAFGAEHAIAAYALFAAPMFGGVADAVSRLVYYRLG